MRRGSKSGERRGGRKRSTPNKRTVLTDRILALAAQHATAARRDFLAIAVDDQVLAADIRLAVARRCSPGARPARPPAKSPASAPVVATRSNGVAAQSLAALDPLLRVAQDVTAAEAVRRRAAADIALFFLPHYLGRRTKKRKKFPADEFGFAVDPKRARELRDLNLELSCLAVGVGLGRKASPAAFAKKVSALQARRAEIERELQSPPPETYSREKAQGAAALRVSALDHDRRTLRYFAQRRANKGVLSDEDDAAEAYLTARVAAFLNGPEAVARTRLSQLEEKDRAFRSGAGRPLTRAERDTHRLLRRLYPLTLPRTEDSIIKRPKTSGVEFEHPFSSEPLGPDGHFWTFEEYVLGAPFYIGDPNRPREERLCETEIQPPRRAACAIAAMPDLWRNSPVSSAGVGRQTRMRYGLPHIPCSPVLH